MINLKQNRLKKLRMKKGLIKPKMMIRGGNTGALEDTRGQVHVTTEDKHTQKEEGHAHRDAEVDHQNISQIVAINTEITHQVAANLAIVTTDVMSTKTKMVMTIEKATINKVAADITTIIDEGEFITID